MVTPESIRQEAAKMDALMEAFEHSYLHFLDLGEGETEERNRGSFAFYALKDMLQKIMADAEELSGHMEVCDAVMAVNHIKRNGGNKNGREA